VYYLALPAFIFRSISKASLASQFQGTALFITLGAAVGAYAVAWLICLLRRVPAGRAGTFIQTAGHGNLGYVGLSIAFYFLGESGLARAGIIAGFLMITQNTLSVIVLQTHAASGRPLDLRSLLVKIFGNPVIGSALAGILASALQVPIPLVVQRSLDMLSGLGPPTALLLIGASLSLTVMRENLRAIMTAVLIKLVILPGIGLLLYQGFQLSAIDYVPGLILLASPTATVTFVMSREMQGDADFAVAAISASTLFSAATFLFWLLVAAPDLG
jgi:predicted permease